MKRAVGWAAPVRAVALLLALAGAGCTMLPGSKGPPAPVLSPGSGMAATPVVRYRCEPGALTVAVSTVGDELRIDGLPQGSDSLLRDAGGLAPQQSVWTSPRLRAEFGLGEGGRQALVHPLQPPGPPLQCVRL